MKPRYFGDPWPSGICETGEQVATPVGELCINCEEPIEEDQQGTFIYAIEDGVMTPKPSHKECSLRSVLGGIGHMKGLCTCNGGNTDPDENLSYRTSALLVWEWVRDHGVSV